MKKIHVNSKQLKCRYWPWVCLNQGQCDIEQQERHRHSLWMEWFTFVSVFVFFIIFIFCTMFFYRIFVKIQGLRWSGTVKKLSLFRNETDWMKVMQVWVPPHCESKHSLIATNKWSYRRLFESLFDKCSTIWSWLKMRISSICVSDLFSLWVISESLCGCVPQ